MTSCVRICPRYRSPPRTRSRSAQLLDHRSGLGDIFGAKYAAAPPARLHELADFVPLFADEPLAFEPGSSERYSNAGYIVLGLLIERLSGERYRDYVAKHILAPAQMTRTGFWALEDHAPACAIGYTRGGLPGERAELGPNTEMLSGRPSSAGGAFATAVDLLRLWRALRGNHLASPVWTNWVLRDSFEAATRPMKLGFAGGSPGVSALMEVDGDWLVVAVANLDPPAAMATARGAMDIIRGTPGPEMPHGPGLNRRAPP